MRTTVFMALNILISLSLSLLCVVYIAYPYGWCVYGEYRIHMFIVFLLLFLLLCFLACCFHFSNSFSFNFSFSKFLVYTVHVLCNRPNKHRIFVSRSSTFYFLAASAYCVFTALILECERCTAKLEGCFVIHLATYN